MPLPTRATHSDTIAGTVRLPARACASRHQCTSRQSLFMPQSGHWCWGTTARPASNSPEPRAAGPEETTLPLARRIEKFETSAKLHLRCLLCLKPKPPQSMRNGLHVKPHMTQYTSPGTTPQESSAKLHSRYLQVLGTEITPSMRNGLHVKCP